MTALLSLDSFREQIGYLPWHFWGLANARVPVGGWGIDTGSKCNALVKKYSWQSVEAAGRVDVANASEAAEARLFDQLRYDVAPRWRETEVLFPRYHNTTREWASYADAQGRWLSVQLPYGKVIGAGVEALTYLGTVAVTYTDPDGDGLKELFTTTALATTVTDATQIAAYFVAADRLNGESASEAYRLSPIRAVISAGSVVVSGPSWLCVKPVKYEGVNPGPLDPDTVGNLATTLDIYTRRNDPTGTLVTNSQAVLIWETRPFPDCGWSLGSSLDPAAEMRVAARVSLHQPEMGVLGVGGAVWSGTAWVGVDACGFRPPDRVIIRTYAGDANETLGGVTQMQRAWRTVAARLTCAEMMRRICSCDAANRELFHWQMDVARANGIQNEQFRVSENTLDNPLGTLLGQVYAWQVIKTKRQITGVLA